MQRGFASIVIGLSLGGLAAPATAADVPSPTYVDRSHTDDDFPFQGEYRGWQRSKPSLRTSEPVGLQVIARGNGEFEATKYPGGLPGNGWEGGNRYPLKGKRNGDTLRLVGDVFDIELHNGLGTIFTKGGRKAGELQAVRRVSPTMGLAPPAEAVELFTGSDTSLLKDAKVSPEGLLQVGTETVGAYRNFRMHAEFLLPYMPAASGQARSNSGLYLQCRYEVQVLDSFGLPGLFNECGSLYRTIPPDFNMCLPPLEWQTYDIDFREPVFDSQGRKVANGRISVWHNGTLIHDDIEIPNKTGAGKPEGPEPLPIKIQDHSNPVQFRNIWLIETRGNEPREWPPLPISPRPLPLLFGSR